MDTKNLKLVKEYPDGVGPNIPLQLYQTIEKRSNDENHYRWHFEYPKNLIEPLCPLIESTPYWGEQHWTEVDGFWIWQLPFTTTTPEIPKEKINYWYKFYGQMFKMCINYLKKQTQ